MIAYVDTSAAAKLLVDEAESVALAAELDRLVADGARPTSSALLETELRRLAIRIDADQTLASDLLDRFDLIGADAAIVRSAGLLPGGALRSLDALHVATAMHVDAEVVLSYDARQSAAARAVGLRVVGPA